MKTFRTSKPEDIEKLNKEGIFQKSVENNETVFEVEEDVPIEEIIKSSDVVPEAKEDTSSKDKKTEKKKDKKKKR